MKADHNTTQMLGIHGKTCMEGMDTFKRTQKLKATPRKHKWVNFYKRASPVQCIALLNRVIGSKVQNWQIRSFDRPRSELLKLAGVSVKPQKWNPLLHKSSSSQQKLKHKFKVYFWFSIVCKEKPSLVGAT